MPAGTLVRADRALLEPLAERGGSFVFADHMVRGRPAHTVAPTLEERQQLGFPAVDGLFAVLARQGVEELFAAGDGVEGFAVPGSI
ncbi:hypothetical protein BH11ACT6_BH11ACT6_07390 [soil metagenome]